MNDMPRRYLMEDNNKDEYPILKTPKGKNIEIKPDGIYGLWIIHPHGTNLPTYLKTAKFTSSDEAIKATQKWFETILSKEE